MKYWSNDILNKIRSGYFTAVYFDRTREILLGEKNYQKVTMQVFQKHKSMLCGVKEVLSLFKSATGYFQESNWVDKSGEVEIHTLEEGADINPWETVMHIKGPYVYFAHLESLYLGIFARSTLVCTNVSKVVKAADGKPVIFFADRFDRFTNQESDGYAAHIGGASGVCTKAHASCWGGEASGTIPHALIAVNGGDTVKATELFAKYFSNPDISIRNEKIENQVEFTANRFKNHFSETFAQNLIMQSKNQRLLNEDFPNELDVRNQNYRESVNLQFSSKRFSSRLENVNVIALVDFDNDCVGTSLAVAKKLGKKLWGVRLDTAGDMIDKSLESQKSKVKSQKSELYGVNPQLVRNVRKALDKAGFEWVKIVVSGGFNAEKITNFEREKAPVDVYGVGSALLKGENDFTADIVEVEGKRLSKVGRKYSDNPKMKKIDLSKI
jgi:nicotinate phosphoribosyltransferase